MATPTLDLSGTVPVAWWRRKPMNNGRPVDLYGMLTFHDPVAGSQLIVARKDGSEVFLSADPGTALELARTAFAAGAPEPCWAAVEQMPVTEEGPSLEQLLQVFTRNLPSDSFLGSPARAAAEAHAPFGASGGPHDQIPCDERAPMCDMPRWARPDHSTDATTLISTLNGDLGYGATLRAAYSVYKWAQENDEALPSMDRVRRYGQHVLVPFRSQLTDTQVKRAASYIEALFNGSDMNFSEEAHAPGCTLLSVEASGSEDFRP